MLRQVSFQAAPGSRVGIVGRSGFGIGDTLTGTAPELIRHYLEVRGIGVVDIQKLFGMSGVKSATARICATFESTEACE